MVQVLGPISVESKRVQLLPRRWRIHGVLRRSQLLVGPGNKSRISKPKQITLKRHTLSENQPGKKDISKL